MDQQQLREYLDQLTVAIEESHAPEEEKDQLENLIIDIERQLNQPMLQADSQSLADQVDSMISNFERDHPTVAGILNNIMVTLSSMGV